MAITYSQELAERAQAYLDRALNDKRSAEGLQELAAIWSAIQGQPAGNCRQCQYSDFNQTLVAYLCDFSRLQNPEFMSDASYQLAPQFINEKLVHEDYSKVVDADNLTDADVAFFTSKGRGDLFVKNNTISDTVDPTSPPEDDSNEPNAEPTEREQELETKLEQVNQQLANQTTSYNAACVQVTAELTTATSALASEKQAHEATKGQLSEVQQQLTEAQAQIAQLMAPKPKAVHKQPAPTAAPVASPAPTAPVSDAPAAS